MKLSIWNLLSPRQRKLVLWVVALLLFYTITGFLILPLIVRSVAVKQISQQLDRAVSIRSVKINPFTLSCAVDGLLIKDPDGLPFISWDEIYANFQLSSLFGKAWVFKEISATKPFVRAQMNQDGTFNFSDLIAKFSTNTAPAKTGPTKPFLLHVERLHIGGATAEVADFTRHVPFKHVLGPLEMTLSDFRTDPDDKNPYALSGTTDTGERYAWRGHFTLIPLRSEGEVTISKVDLNKYAPLYQDFVKFEIRDGSIALHANYRFAWSASNHVASVTDTSLALRNFKLGAIGQSNNLVELPLFGIAGVNVDLEKRQAEIGTVYVHGGKFFLKRDTNNAINVVELAKPADNLPKEPGGVLALLRSVTNTVSLLLNSTNQWAGAIRNVDLTNCAVHLEDDANSRPATLELTDIALAAKNISNLPGTNLDADLSLRWNTNGAIKLVTSASFLPPTANVQLDLDQLDLGTLDPYLEPKLNLFILGSRLNLHGKVRLSTPAGQLPEVTFQGNTSLDGFRTVDGVFGEDLLKWDSLQFNGIDANLNPPSVAIKEILLDNAYARLIIETNKTLNLLNALRLTDTNAPNTNAAAVALSPQSTTTNAPPLNISIGAVVITNSVVSFSDRSIQPNVNMAIQSMNGSIADISTKQLQHAGLNFAAKVDGVGPINISGTLNPFSGTETNTVKISFKDVDLTPVSPYAGKFAGYRIAKGKLNLDLNYEIVGKKLESKNVITLDQFTFGESVNSTNATHLPVRLAVAIMKDRAGKIVLDVPVAGRTDDPQFRIRKVVFRAVVNILTKAATSPFSLLGAVFGGGGEELGYQEFAVGSSELTPADIQKLDSLSKGLYERPALNLEITGSVDPDGDREGLQRAALDQEIRTRLWTKLRKDGQATNSVDQLVLTPEERADGIKTLYNEAVAAGKITPELIAANTNLAAYAATIPTTATRPATIEKGATRLVNASSAAGKPAAAVVYHTKLVPPPDPTEAVLLATYPVTDADLNALAARRAKAVQDYLLQSGKVTANRLFLKQGEVGTQRNDGSRAYLQFR